MGKRGPKTEPTVLKILKGNPSKTPLTPNEVKPAPSFMDCPEWLDDYAKEVWGDLVPKLEKYGLFTEVDYIEFTNLCILVSVVRQAYDILKKKPKTKRLTFVNINTGNDQVRAELQIISNNVRIISQLAAKFGLSPSDRSGLTTPKSQEKSSKLEGLLSG